MSNKTRANDRSSIHRCRIELPNLIDDMGLSVYEFRLYVHLKRVAQDDGSCWESTRTLATCCNMAMGQVSKAKAELEKRGLIARQTKDVRGGQVDDIIIVDIWPQNFKAYAPESQTATESVHHTNASDKKAFTTRTLSESVHLTNALGESVHQVNTSTSKRSPDETMNHDLPYRESDLDPPPPPLPPVNGGGGGGGENLNGEKPNKTELYYWLCGEGGVDSPTAAERNQHHDPAATEALHRKMVGDAVGAERKKLVGRFIRKLDADGPPPLAPPATNGRADYDRPAPLNDGVSAAQLAALLPAGKGRR